MIQLLRGALSANPSGTQTCTTYLQAVQWTSSSQAALVQYMSINHGCLHIRMPKQFLNRANVRPRFQKMCGKGVPKSVASHPLAKTQLAHRPANLFLQHRFMKMVPSPSCRLFMEIMRSRRNNPLPRPLPYKREAISRGVPLFS
jgi:hypothetical protein